MPSSTPSYARVLTLSLAGLSCACAGRDPHLEAVFRENQQALIECQVARAGAEKEADLARGQRELAEREAEAAMGRLARAEEALRGARAYPGRRAPRAEPQGAPQGGPQGAPQGAQEAQEAHGERARAEAHPGDHVLRALSDQDLITLAERLGHSATPLERGVLVTFGDLKSRLSFNAEHKVLSFISHFSGYSSGLELANAWNRDHRFGRVFIDAQGDIALETELDLEPGVRLEALVAWARSYGVLLTLFHGSLKSAEGGKRGGKGKGREGERRGQQM